MRKSIFLFIGGINKGELPRGGEEYKNQIILNRILQEQINVIIIDTVNWEKRPKVWFKIIYYVFFSKIDKILISASTHSSYRLLSLINLFKPNLLLKISYLVVGGFLPDAIAKGYFDWRIYKNIKKIIVQGEKLSNKLKIHSELNNIIVIPNFKFFPNMNFTFNTRIDYFRFVYVGRVIQEKGIDIILEAATIIREAGKNMIIDIYGPIEHGYKFDREKIHHRGYLNFQSNPIEMFQKLSEYDCFLFPTYWIGEGFPGVIIDAYIAGLPVIASDWNMNSEVVEDGVNGFIIDPRNADALAEKMIWVMENRDQLEEIRKNNIEKAKDYHIDTVWPKLMDCVLR